MTKFATAVQGAGAALVVYALWALYPPAAILVAGLMVIAVGVAWELNERTRQARSERAARDVGLEGGERAPMPTPFRRR